MLVQRSAPRALATLCLVLLIGSACALPGSTGGSVETGPRVRAGIRITPVIRGEITSLMTFPGELRPKPGAIVTAKVSGRLDKLMVEPGSAVREGDVVAELDRSALELQVLQAQAALAAAEARLAGLKAGGEPDARAAAEATLRAARARLGSLEAAPRIETIPALTQTLREARRRVSELESGQSSAVAAAEANLNQARQRLDALLTSVPAPEASPVPVGPAVEQARAAVQQAQQQVTQARQPVSGDELAAARQQLADAEDALMLARWPVGPSDLDEARANVEAAEIRLRQAGQPSSEAAIKAGESSVDYAWASLELARLQLREATLVSPITGTVVETHLKQGASVTVGAPILSVQPPDYEMAVAIEERQLGQVTVGQGVNIQVDVYPGESFTGTVRSLAPSIDPRARTVAGKVDIQDPRGKLKSGMLAQVAVTGTKRVGVLLVPREAIVGTTDTSVLTVAEGRARRFAVQVGVQDGRNVEIVRGLTEGMDVILTPAGILEGDQIGDK